jgi:flagellar biosynthesis chaperone FliJ
MTKEQRDKILKALAEERNGYVRDCNRRIAEENGKITGADYMLQRFIDALSTEVEPQESEETNADSD